jgi:hypothetical protein
VIVEIFSHRQICGGTERAENERDAVLLHQLASLFDRLRRTVGIVKADQFYVSAVNSSLTLTILM